jgi:hypothetical protein
MNEIVQICPNITLVHDEGFGDFCVPIVSDVIMNIDMAFSRALSIHFFSSNPCIIKYNHFKDEPRCSDTADGRVIYLHTHDDYWCQWAYQFAHEYCHHLINVKNHLPQIRIFEKQRKHSSSNRIVMVSVVYILS